MKLFICSYCGSERKNHNSWRNHERCCPSNLNRNYKNGMTGKKGSNQYKKAEELGLPKPQLSDESREKIRKSSTGRKHAVETKRILSEKRSLNNKGGRSKWYEVNGIKVQGTWERNVAKILTENNIKWLKPSTANHSFKYNMDGKTRTYTPDFYLIDQKIYLEIKGYWWGNDKEKMKNVTEQNPNANVMIIEKYDYERILSGELVW